MPKVEVDLPEEVIRDIQDLADRKGISPTDALVEAVATTKSIADKAPHGARIVPVSRASAIRRKRAAAR